MWCERMLWVVCAYFPNDYNEENSPKPGFILASHCGPPDPSWFAAGGPAAVVGRPSCGDA